MGCSCDHKNGFEELMHAIAQQMGGTDKITIRQFFNFPEYEMFKTMLGDSLVLNANAQLLPDEILNQEMAA